MLGVRGLARVSSHVVFELVLVSEVLLADFTDQAAPGVDPHVGFTLLTAAESLSAKPAGKGLLARVAPHVDD